MVTDENAGDQPFHFSHGTLGLGHLNGARTLSCFNDSTAPLQSDHIRILESDIAAWASEIFEITQRSWIGQYLTLELTKIQSTERLTRAEAW
jgi:hypothetical protein